MKPVNWKHKLALVWVLFLALWLSGCGGILEISVDQTPTPQVGAEATVAVLQTQVATLLPAQTPLDLSSDSETIRRRMLESHEHWQSLWMDGLVTDYSGDAGPLSRKIQVWVNQPGGQFRLLSGPGEQAPDQVQVSDGQSVVSIHLPEGSREVAALPEAARLPYEAPQGDSQGISLHPLGSMIQTLANQALFPSALAQRSGDFRPIEIATTAGRSTLMVEWYRGPQLWDRFWVDVETGVLLRWQSFGKGDAEPRLEVLVNQVEYQPPFVESLFSTQVGEVPQFALDSSGQAGAVPQPPDAVFEPGEGELYFVVNGLNNGEGLRLVRLPGTCLTGEADCPEVQVVEGYPNIDGMIEPLTWSADGTNAAVIVLDNTRAKSVLWRYTPQVGDWAVLAEFQLSGLNTLVWSPDGQRLVFSAKSSDTVEDLWEVRADGSGLRNLTGGQFAGEGHRVVAMDWLNEDRVAFWVITGRIAEMYTALVPVDGAGDVQIEKLNNLTLPNGLAALAPDHRSMVYGTQTEEEGAILSLAAPDGSEARRIASFQHTSFQDLQWTPDGAWVVFRTLSGSASGEWVTTVYAIRADGTDLRQLYQSGNILRMVIFSNGTHVLVEDGDTQRFVVLTLTGGQPRTPEIPGLRLDQQWIGPSWRN